MGLKFEAFRVPSVLVRKVGGSMLLEVQRKAVKRQALIDRALERDLPERMSEVLKHHREPHIPWYYERVLDTADEKDSRELFGKTSDPSELRKAARSGVLVHADRAELSVIKIEE